MRRFVVFAAVLLAAAAPQSSPLPSGYWALDEIQGPSAFDAAGGGHGTWNGTPTRLGSALPTVSYANSGALGFSDAGADQFVALPNTTALDTLQSDSYSISAWFRPASVPPGTAGANNANYAIVCKAGWHEGLLYDNARQFMFQHWTVNAAGESVWNGTGTWGVTHAPGSWYHVVGTWDRAAGLVSIYVNGTRRGQTAWAANAPNRDFGTTPWRIGIAGPAYVNYKWQANGAIDDVRLYGYALSAIQVETLAAGVPPPTNLAATTETIGEIALSWSPPPQPLTYTYTLERRPAFGLWVAYAKNLSATSYVDTDVARGTTYEYRVLASSVALSGPSNVVSAVRTEPPPRTAPLGKEREQCGCGSTSPPGPAAAIALAAAALCVLFFRRP
jgi:uncharacterized protein (TIGR03382 family)